MKSESGFSFAIASQPLDIFGARRNIFCSYLDCFLFLSSHDFELSIKMATRGDRREDNKRADEGDTVALGRQPVFAVAPLG